MPDDEFIEPFAAPEIFIDGFTEHSLRDGVMTCIGYRSMPAGKTIVVRLAWPAVNTMSAVEEAEAALAYPIEPPPKPSSKRGVH